MAEEVRHVDVFIVGGGPAGAVCGSLLQRAGVGCLVVDHATFPRDKICGGGLTVKAWRLLQQLLPDLTYDYRPVKHLRLRFEDDPDCEFDSEFELRMTSRKDFDYALIKYYLSAGGVLLKGSFARYELLPDGRILVTLKSGQQISCRYLVAADGAYSLIRRQMFGDYEANAFFIEQYTEKTGDHEIFVQFRRAYRVGCLYKFPGISRDTWGFRAPETTRERFVEALREHHVPQGRIVGAYIPMQLVESTDDRIIFIGDAGGFSNRITGEGLYDAFKTAYNAKKAIVEHRPFSETNRQVFRKMRSQDKLYHFCNENVFFMSLFRHILRHPRLFKWMFDTKMKRETWMGGN